VEGRWSTSVTSPVEGVSKARPLPETPVEETNGICEIYGDGSKPWYLVNIKIAGKWMFIPLKMVLIGIDPYPDA
jgi:hypothetical protein